MSNSMNMGIAEGLRTPENGRGADALTELVECECRDDGAGFAGGGGHAVCGGTETRGEDLRRVNLSRNRQVSDSVGTLSGLQTHVGCRVGAEVEEELE